MAQANDQTAILLQNLTDAGCDEDTVKRCLHFSETGNVTDALSLLKDHRCRVRGEIKAGQKQLDALDYLIYQMQKRGVQTSESQTATVSESTENSQPDIEIPEVTEPETIITEEKTEMTRFVLQIGAYSFTATPADTQAAKELLALVSEAPITVAMDDYSGFEKVGSLGRSLTATNAQTTTTAGDIVLYNGNNIVIFYGSNSWSYTRLGRIDDLTDWETALGSGSVSLTISAE